MSLIDQLKQAGQSIQVTIEEYATKHSLTILRGIQVRRISGHRARYTANCLLQVQGIPLNSNNWNSNLKLIKRQFARAVEKDIKFEQWRYLGCDLSILSETDLAMNFIFEIPNNLLPIQQHTLSTLEGNE